SLSDRSAAVTSRRSGPSRASTRRARGTGAPEASSMLSTMAASRPIASGSDPGVSGSGVGSSAKGPSRPFPFTCSSRLIARSAVIRLLLHRTHHADLPHLLRPCLRLREIRDGQVELDGPEPFPLNGPYHLKPDQLEERKEGRDDLSPGALRREHVRELDRRPQRALPEYALDALRHGQPRRHNHLRSRPPVTSQHRTQIVDH